MAYNWRMMKLSRSWLCILILALLAGCRTAETPTVPTIIPFPTVTPGQALVGLLATPDFSAIGGVINPATAAALAAQPTATPDTRTCPTPAEITLPEDAPTTAAQMTAVILDYLSDGGAFRQLENTLRDDWDVLGYLRNALDLSGDTTPEVIIGYTTPEGGMLLIAGCLEGRYVNRYQATSDALDPPEILNYDDMNRDQRPDLLFTTQVCEGDICRFRTQLITWRADVGRFVGLLDTTLISDEPPELLDFDNDEVVEIVIRQNNRGNLTTGPLRTGVNIYDWNGELYVLSIVRPDPPRFRVQIIHEADRYFNQFDMPQATTLYQQAVSNDELRNWRDDEEANLRAYVFYRLLLARAYEGDGPEQLQTIVSRTEDAFPEAEAAPVYVAMSRVFLTAYQVNGDDLAAACADVMVLVTAQPQAVDLLNRYGNRSPTYTATDLCPFA